MGFGYTEEFSFRPSGVLLLDIGLGLSCIRLSARATFRVPLD
uniref:Uncharacterized protein n=1 Tax=Manihot esculenta TaxID=3983 RepID=A0A2C9UBD0_MANES